MKMCRILPFDTFASFGVFNSDKEVCKCLLPINHKGPHLINVSGKCFAWKSDYGCGCCKPSLKSRCYDYWEVESVAVFLKEHPG